MSFPGSFLPSKVDAELEFDSVIPPPDMIKEEREKLLSLLHEPITYATAVHAKVNSKREISNAPSGSVAQGALRIQPVVRQSAVITTLIVRPPELKTSG